MSNKGHNLVNNRANTTTNIISNNNYAIIFKNNSNKNQINQNEKIKLSENFNIEVTVSREKIILEKNILELIKNVYIPKMTDYNDDLDKKTRESLYDDYFLYVEYTTKDISQHININKYIIDNELGNHNNYKYNNDKEYVRDILNFFSKVKNLKNNYIDNVDYRIKLLVQEKLIIFENKKSYDYIFILLLRINYDLYSYIFFVNNSDFTFDSINSFLSEKIIPNNAASYTSEKRKQKVLFDNSSVQIKYIDEELGFNFDSIKIIELLKKQIISLDSINFCKCKTFNICIDDLYELIPYLSMLQNNYPDNIDIIILIERNEIEVKSESKNTQLIIIFRNDCFLFKFTFKLDNFSYYLKNLIKLFEDNNIIYFLPKIIIENKYYKIKIDYNLGSSGYYLDVIKIFESLNEPNFNVDNINFYESKKFNSNIDFDEIKKLILDLYANQVKDKDNLDYILRINKYDSKFFIFIRCNDKLYSYEYIFNDSNFSEEIEKLSSDKNIILPGGKNENKLLII